MFLNQLNALRRTDRRAPKAATIEQKVTLLEQEVEKLQGEAATHTPMGKPKSIEDLESFSKLDQRANYVQQLAVHTGTFAYAKSLQSPSRTAKTTKNDRATLWQRAQDASNTLDTVVEAQHLNGLKTKDIVGLIKGTKLYKS